jgi:hypothetical protein
MLIAHNKEPQALAAEINEYLRAKEGAPDSFQVQSIQAAYTVDTTWGLGTVITAENRTEITEATHRLAEQQGITLPQFIIKPQPVKTVINERFETAEEIVMARHYKVAEEEAEEFRKKLEMIHIDDPPDGFPLDVRVKLVPTSYCKFNDCSREAQDMTRQLREQQRLFLSKITTTDLPNVNQADTPPVGFDEAFGKGFGPTLRSTIKRIEHPYKPKTPSFLRHTNRRPTHQPWYSSTVQMTRIWFSRWWLDFLFSLNKISCQSSTLQDGSSLGPETGRTRIFPDTPNTPNTGSPTSSFGWRNSLSGIRVGRMWKWTLAGTLAQ